MSDLHPKYHPGPMTLTTLVAMAPERERPTPAELKLLATWSDDKRLEGIGTRFGVYYDGLYFYACNRHTSARIACKIRPEPREVGMLSMDEGVTWEPRAAENYAPIWAVFDQAARNLKKRREGVPVTIQAPFLREVAAVSSAIAARERAELQAARPDLILEAKRTPMRRSNNVKGYVDRQLALIARGRNIEIDACEESVKFRLDRGRWEILICPVNT